MAALGDFKIAGLNTVLIEKLHYIFKRVTDASPKLDKWNPLPQTPVIPQGLNGPTCDCRNLTFVQKLGGIHSASLSVVTILGNRLRQGAAIGKL